MDPVGEKLLEIAKKELGYKEKAGGYTKYGDWYGKNVEDGDDYYTTAPWCDMFLSWAAEQAGLQDWVGQFAATIDHAKWFQKQKAWGTRPEPGALVFFSWSGSEDLDSIEHVGIVESVKGSTLHTIEANTDGIYLKRKTRDVSEVVGYGYPGKVKVAGKTLPGAATPATARARNDEYVPKHAAPAPAVTTPQAQQPATALTSQPTASKDDSPLVPQQQEALLGGLLAVALCGTAALAAGKAAAARVPTEAPIRVRKRGKHHRVPVALPADITPAEMAEAAKATAMMPAISAAVAAEAEDREFWSRISTLEDDKELAFWDTLHAEFTPARPETAALEPADAAPGT